MRSYLVAGVDVSTQACKVVVADPADGRIVRTGHAPHPNGTETDPQAWWEAFCRAVDAAGGLDDVAALSVGGQQHGMVCLDAEGRVIRPAILWNDTRSAQAAEELIGERSAGWWAETTGSVPVASLTVTKLRWLAEHEPENAARIAAICLPHDWVTWKIRGSSDIADLVTDRSDASGTGYFERCSHGGRSQSYRYDIVADALGISEEGASRIKLPSVARPWEVVGCGSTEMGWGHVRLGPGCGDNAGAALGLGLVPGEAMLSLGTSGVVAAVSDRSVADPKGLVTGFCDATGRWLPLACTLNGARIVDAMMAVTGAGSYDEFNQWALSVPDSGGLQLTPYFEGERTPNLPDATASLTGMTLANSDGRHVARAAIEGLLTLMRGALDAVRAAGTPITKVAMIGGGARSRSVRELAPEVLGIPVTVPETREFVALGAARQAARAIGSKWMGGTP